MFCIHGLLQENCPHCLAGTRINPPTILVKPAMREIPLRVPARDLLMEKKVIQSNELFSQNKLNRLPLQAPTREFNLAQHYFGAKPGLFQERKAKLQGRYDTLPNEEVSINDIPLYGLKQRLKR